VHATAQPEPLQERLDRRDEAAGHEELRVRMLPEQRGERPQPELEPVRLRLVAAEQEHGPAGR
jgi:hypothetical protein